MAASNGYVFISYKSEEKALADRIKSFLEQNGFKWWMAPDSLDQLGTQDYSADIFGAIRECTCLIFAVSPSSLSSKWVNREVRYANDNCGKPIIPFVVSAIPDEVQKENSLFIILEMEKQILNSACTWDMKVLMPYLNKAFGRSGRIASSSAVASKGATCQQVNHKLSNGKTESDEGVEQVTHLASLASNPNGQAWIKLAYVASFFSPEGLQKHILRYLWGTLVAPDADADLEFDQAIDTLKRYGIIFDSGVELRINLFAITAIRRFGMATDADVEGAIGKALALYKGMRPEDWLLLAGNERILRYIPRMFLFTRDDFGVSLQTRILCKNISFQNECHWDCFNENDWRMLLKEHPRFISRCPLAELGGYSWATLLGAQPRFADRCPWEELDGESWAALLEAQPQFSDRCPWEELDGDSWATLLGTQPQFADHCPFEKLGGYDWETLLSAQPQFSDRCPWEELYVDSWATLLGAQPQFADRCPWEELDGYSWATLLGAQPQFSDRCPWEKLDGYSWATLLEAQPQFADRCPWEELDGKSWATLLIAQPQFSNRCPWDRLVAGNWIPILLHQPQFADICPWESFKGVHWRFLLRRMPQFAYHCPWNKLDGRKCHVRDSARNARDAVV